jgi:hypothetical protein
VHSPGTFARSGQGGVGAPPPRTAGTSGHGGGSGSSSAVGRPHRGILAWSPRAVLTGGARGFTPLPRIASRGPASPGAASRGRPLSTSGRPRPWASNPTRFLGAPGPDDDSSGGPSSPGPMGVATLRSRCPPGLQAGGTLGLLIHGPSIPRIPVTLGCHAPQPRIPVGTKVV